MLELKNIKKDYPTGGETVHALRGVSMKFRRNEFVSILGPSGCGKTTMLNIIGGLDGYTDGDLLISGRSTKSFKDRDWDAYRNHSVGFVFQSYNLIPHQTVLSNVELALALSGVPKAERRRRAKDALVAVGLGDQIKKKPGEMSGGQMQRVAIARALVNDPDIILADEPTGALDTETSVQVMEILKNISRDRLVIMVTHNPELAEKYSSRIIRMLDGSIVSDSRPITPEELRIAPQPFRRPAEGKKSRKTKKPSLSFGTSFMLSLKNLISKKGRTALTSFAGSIGIIGIALIMAMSAGMTAYIDAVQESTLSAYPLTLEASTVELTSLMNAFMNVSTGGEGHDRDAVYKKSALYDMITALNSIEETENDLKSFNEFIKSEMAKEDSQLAAAINGIQYSYPLDLLVYTKNDDGKILRSETEEILMDLMMKYMKVDMSAMVAMREMSPMGSMATTMTQTLWQEMLPGDNGAEINDLILDQYEAVYGRFPESYDEVVLVVDEYNELDDVTLYALGLLPEEEMDKLADAALNGADLEKNDHKWSYEEICSREYKVILNPDCYSYDELSGKYTDLRETEAGLRYLYDNAMSLKIVGIIRPSDDADTHMLSGNICYTSALTRHVIRNAADSEAIKAQLDSVNTDIFTGLPFKETQGELDSSAKETAFREYISGLDGKGKADAFIKISSIPPAGFVEAQLETMMGGLTREDIEKTLIEGMKAQMSVKESEITAYLSAMSDDELKELFSQLAAERITLAYAEGVAAQMSAMTTEQLSGALDMAMAGYTEEQCALYYDEIMAFSESDYETNLEKLGYIDTEYPSAINIYATTFENKDVITAAIESYNNTVEELKEIKYTDYLGIMMSSITTIINAITYVLIAFVSISLVVSSIMIAVITLISVQERTKEIGILRAIGASKRNVSGMFNAETVIIGFTSGLLGVTVTYLLCIPINLILHALTGIANLNAILPVKGAVSLVAISVILTLISGIIPSRSAAKKDPVVALRTE
ncbi:MAG: ABC transporter ATP-binding protein/permease [Clostridia bacterium]|nr:ABC transporter ATP-binding protein/permease [Clostridia bacterium]